MGGNVSLWALSGGSDCAIAEDAELGDCWIGDDLLHSNHQHTRIKQASRLRWAGESTMHGSAAQRIPGMNKTRLN